MWAWASKATLAVSSRTSSRRARSSSPPARRNGTRLAYYSPTNSSSNYFEVLSNLNNTLGPFYRYESGTSLSAAEVSGALALMQEFFQRLRPHQQPGADEGAPD